MKSVVIMKTTLQRKVMRTWRQHVLSQKEAERITMLEHLRRQEIEAKESQASRRWERWFLHVGFMAFKADAAKTAAEQSAVSQLKVSFRTCTGNYQRVHFGRWKKNASAIAAAEAKIMHSHSKLTLRLRQTLKLCLSRYQASCFGRWREYVNIMVVTEAILCKVVTRLGTHHLMRIPFQKWEYATKLSTLAESQMNTLSKLITRLQKISYSLILRCQGSYFDRWKQRLLVIATLEAVLNKVLAQMGTRCLVKKPFQKWASTTKICIASENRAKTFGTTLKFSRIVMDRWKVEWDRIRAHFKMWKGAAGLDQKYEDAAPLQSSIDAALHDLTANLSRIRGAGRSTKPSEARPGRTPSPRTPLWETGSSDSLHRRKHDAHAPPLLLPASINKVAHGSPSAASATSWSSRSNMHPLMLSQSTKGTRSEVDPQDINGGIRSIRQHFKSSVRAVSLSQSFGSGSSVRFPPPATPDIAYAQWKMKDEHSNDLNVLVNSHEEHTKRVNSLHHNTVDKMKRAHKCDMERVRWKYFKRLILANTRMKRREAPHIFFATWKIQMALSNFMSIVPQVERRSSVYLDARSGGEHGE